MDKNKAPQVVVVMTNIGNAMLIYTTFKISTIATEPINK